MCYIFVKNKQTEAMSIIPKERRIEMMKELTKHYHLERKADFAKKSGMSKLTAYNWIVKGDFDEVKLYEIFDGEISGEWLLSGDGPMLKSEIISTPDNSEEVEKYKNEIESLKNTLKKEEERYAKLEQRCDKLQEWVDRLIKLD